MKHDFPHCHVVNDVLTVDAEAPMAEPTYVRLHGDSDVLVVGAPGIAVASCELTSGANVLTIIVYSLADEADPDDDSIGMAHNMTVEHARDIARSINDLCDRAESEAAAIADAAIAKARGL